MSKRGPGPKATGGAALVERIFDRVVVDPETGCAIWRGARGGGGYASMWVHGAGCLRVSRVVMMLCGAVLKRGDVVMHTCDNPACVSPHHLRVGSQAENMADRDAKGRAVWRRGQSHAAAIRGALARPEVRARMVAAARRGEANSGAKLTDDAVRAIRRDPGSLREVGARYGVSYQTVLRIRQRKTWQHVTDGGD
jgi:hypothetical protein